MLLLAHAQKFSGVCVYNFEREAVSSTIKIEGPVNMAIN